MPSTLTITCYDPLLGSAGEALWREGEASYVLDGRAEHVVVTPPHPATIGWCAWVDGALAGIQACRLVAGEPFALGLLSYVRPQYRQQGIFSAIQQAVDADLLARGCDRIRSRVVPGFSAEAMAAAIEARGGAAVGTVPVETPRGPDAYVEYERLIFLGPG